ncbi:unnamed protein product [Rotaria magnacalcarata]|uniref:Uncharacterized protein n=2 Tax=Rotaria magnacalcarata TaxID=392030 RepID=A0A816U1R1_9BILA|nr:unnamed protein product [Rotaria magnacalcarata]CAF1559197.1 unnamed protein product [Rotaria magnacalcarata]CAF2079650.1 unnamed protein product [Rotaria magnacalcarata]CAF2103627.1 unnamed protein product [Rotaria magnacalcarata]CAF2218810.1 unnamed protein product [Rotaria magnacalcarata]
MVSRFTDLERKTILVQFIAVEPLTFYTTSDGTDLVQDTLRLHLSRQDADILGQEGSLSIDEQGEFLTFEPLDTKNRTLHLPTEHLAYCGALRRMRPDTSDQRDLDQIHRREFENVDLANRFAHYIVGPPIFATVFHGFDNALCYIFVTQSADDACLLVMKLMRAFKLHEQKLQQQGQINQGHSSLHPFSSGGGSPLPVDIKRDSPLLQSSQGFLNDNRQSLSSPFVHQAPTTTINSYNNDPRQDEIIQRLLANPNLELVSQPTPFYSQRISDIPIMSTPSMNQRSTPITFNNSGSSLSNIPYMNRSSPQLMRPPSPPILGLSDNINAQNMSFGNTNPQVIYKQNNQEVVYKQNIMVRWLQPPTPPPPAPIIIREVQAPGTTQPPLVCRQMPPCPRTPPPIIIREKPPPCPPTGQPLIIEKRIPPIALPRQVIVERYPAPPAKPPTIIYEKYLPQTQQPRQVFVKREVCRPTGYPVVQQQLPCRQIVREVVRQNQPTFVCAPQQQTTNQPTFVCAPQQQTTNQPTFVCVPQQQQQTATQPQAVQQLVPIFAAQQNVVQPQGVRIIRQVIGPSQGAMQQPQQMYSTMGAPMVQAVQSNFMH